MRFTKYIKSALDIRGIDADPVEVEKLMLTRLMCGFSGISTARFDNYMIAAGRELAGGGVKCLDII